MSFDYSQDSYGARCLELARESKAQTGFGALVVANGEVVGAGRNRRSQPGEDERLGGDVDYATHAEQAALLAALDSRADLSDCEVYVLGEVRRGKDSGKLSVRSSDRDHFFTCVRCARSLTRFGVAVNIPLPSGWLRLGPEQALETATAFRAAGRQRAFTACAA